MNAMQAEPNAWNVDRDILPEYAQHLQYNMSPGSRGRWKRLPSRRRRHIAVSFSSGVDFRLMVVEETPEEEKHQAEKHIAE